MRATVTVSVVAVLLLSGCGGPSQEQKDTAKKERVKAEKFSVAASEARTVAATCRQQVRSLLSALKETESRLQVGMNFSDYGEQVGDVSVGYNKMPIQRMDPDCVGGPGIYSEKAFNSYTKAYNAWNSCFDDLSCDMDAIDPELQAHWTKAAQQTSRARSSLAKLEALATETQEAAEKQAKKAEEAEAALK